MLIERTGSVLPSIGLDAPTLLAFKQHAALSTFAGWTAQDPLLCNYLLAAEARVDKLSGQPYRARSFTISFTNLERFHKPQGRFAGRYSLWDTACSFYGLRIPVRPLSGTPTIAWKADDGTSGTYTAVTDFQITGPTTDPTFFFPWGFCPKPANTIPYPFVVSCATSGNADGVSQVCIFELAAYYTRFPEAAYTDALPETAVFQANMTHLCNSFL